MAAEGEAATTQPPDQSELVIGLVGAVGVDLSAIYSELQAVLTDFAYECFDLHLTDALGELDWDVETVDTPIDERIWSFMDAGRELRTRWDRDDAFALLAINAIQRQRQQVGSYTEPLPRRAYVLRSLKRRDEVKLLRSVYGSRFVQISVYSPAHVRGNALAEQIGRSRQHPASKVPTHSVQAILDRDLAEAAEHGQQVRKFFHEGDFFVTEHDAKTDLRRVIEVLFGHPHRIPTTIETGMLHAVVASGCSAELGRQVGAAICTSTGALIATGYNEVPKAGGGMYPAPDGTDHREYHNETRMDTNDRKKRELAESLAEMLVEADLASDAAAVAGKLAASPIDDLIEFVRAVHAEMAALTDAARRGIAVEGATLFATTFPCHHCARHILAAGIGRVVYVEPYPKSLAEELHGDAICVDHASHETGERITFEPFVGVGPRRHLELFRMPQRKDDDGRILEFAPKNALPRIDAIESDEMVTRPPAYIKREDRAMDLLALVQLNCGPAFRDLEPGD